MNFVHYLRNYLTRTNQIRNISKLFLLRVNKCQGEYFNKKGKLKLKCTLLQALRLSTGRTANSGSRGIPLLYRN